ncbi:sensor histidine kinase [Streptoalloteichus hindustanus]|uniref:histidine kinase n=1 Tax=Streptoalloteichus hindustanus TaxID=2017 RepID=A0A1M4V735_STRHI|nr:histidine kinase [Streptoalloteichus hindustanus]SHE64707.1 Signal transduction histidine kinase [Streptoalloteichus hindustanus]
MQHAVVEAGLLFAVLALPTAWTAFVTPWAAFGWWSLAGSLLAPVVVGLLSPTRPLLSTLLAAVLWCACMVSRKALPEVGVLPFALALATSGYLAGVRSPGTRPALLGFGAVAVGAAAAVPLLTSDSGATFVAVAGVLLLGVVPWLVGRYRRQYRELVRAGWERAEHLEREQRIVAEQARLRERARLAGDMHDLLGHELGLVALRIGALELAPDLAERHRTAAGEARSAVTAAADRLAEIVGLLRGTHPSPDRPGEDVADLVERSRASGVAVELRVTGDRGQVPPLVRRTAYRVVQEALTNAVKHAPGRPVTVSVDHLPGETRVSVTNGRPPVAAPPAAGGRYGLVGLAERVRLVGGAFDAGWRGEEFAVSAVLPHGDARPGPEREPAERSESALRLDEARQRVRRSLVTAVTAGVLVTLGVVATTIAFVVYDAATSVLRPADFDQLHVGQPRSEVEPVLPPRTRVDQSPVPEPARPAGAACRYYGADADPFAGRMRLLRLCFRDDRLVAKDRVGPAEVGSTTG